MYKKKMAEAVITVNNLVKKFGAFTANDNLNFEVFNGEIFGFFQVSPARPQGK
jgi:ABC-2 type transport system ATP-binding protein